MMALPGTPAIQNAIPMPFFGTTPFAAPGLGLLASAIMLGFGLWWLARAERAARARGEGFSDSRVPGVDETVLRQRAVTAREFDPAEAPHGHQSTELPPPAIAVLPLFVVIGVNMAMSFLILPARSFDWLAQPRW